MNLTFYPYTLKLKHKFVLSKHSGTTTLIVSAEIEHKRMKIISGKIEFPEGNEVGFIKKSV